MQGGSWLVRIPRNVALVALVALVGVVGCASGGRTAPFAPASDGQANVVVYLSNESSARRSVVLAVYVDGRLALRETLTSVDRPKASHGFPEEFPLRIAPGPHTIKVVAEGQVASASTEIVVGAGTLHVDASYDWEPGAGGRRRFPEKISLDVGTERPGFC